MSYYSYHGRIKQRIANGDLIGFRFVDDYPRIGTALVLQFNDNPVLRPIRPERWMEYVGTLLDWSKEHENSDENIMALLSVCSGSRV